MTDNDKAEYEFQGKDLIAALNEALECVKVRNKAKKQIVESPKKIVLPAKKHLAVNRLRTAAL